MTSAGLDGAWIFGGFRSPGEEGSLVPDVTITAEFKDGGLFGSGGCNRYWATCTAVTPQANTGQIRIGGIGSTDRSCSAEVNAGDRQF